MAVVWMRRRLLQMIRAFDAGKEPPGLDPSIRYDQIFSNIDVDRFVPVRWLYAADFVFDEVMVEGRAVSTFVGIGGSQDLGAGQRPAVRGGEFHSSH